MRITMTTSLRARCFGGGGFRRSEVHALPDGLGDGPRMQDLRELAGILDRPVRGAKFDDGPGLLGADARELEQLGGVREIDPHCVRHERLLDDLGWDLGYQPTPDLIVAARAT